MKYDHTALQKIRRKQLMTQKDVANALQIHTTTYARWEQNTLTIKLADLLTLADFFNVTLDAIAGRSLLEHGTEK